MCLCAKSQYVATRDIVERATGWSRGRAEFAEWREVENNLAPSSRLDALALSPHSDQSREAEAAAPIPAARPVAHAQKKL